MSGWIPKIHRPIIDKLLKWGIIHLLILKIISDEGETWKNQIEKLLYERYGLSVGSGSLQSRMFLQQKLGYIEKVREEWGIMGSKKRKIYRVTPKGLDLLKSSIEFLEYVLRRLREPPLKRNIK